jgi:hypothetical protein
LLFFAQLNFVIPAQAGSIPTPLHLDTVFQRYDGRCPSPGCLSGHDGFFDFASTTEQSFLVIVIFRAFSTRGIEVTVPILPSPVLGDEGEGNNYLDLKSTSLSVIPAEAEI